MQSALNLADAPDLDDEDLVDWFAEQLGIDDDEVNQMAEAAEKTAGILAALAFLKLFAAGWEALDGAHADATEAHTIHVGPALTERLGDIELDMRDDLGERLATGWGGAGGEVGTEVTGLSDISAQSEYSESKSSSDQDEGWEYARYIAQADACDVCQDCHGTVLPIGDPWWDEHEPDNNHPNCCCIKVPLSEAEAKAAGVSTSGPSVESSGWKNKWPPDVTRYPDPLEAVFHSKLS